MTIIGFLKCSANISKAAIAANAQNQITGAATSASVAGMTSSLDSNNSTTNSTPSTDLVDPYEQQIMDGTIAHGIMGAMAFVFLFPSGSIIMRVFNFKYVMWVHVGLQIMSYLIALTVLETGVWIAVYNDEGRLIVR